MSEILTRRLMPGDTELAIGAFAMMVVGVRGGRARRCRAATSIGCSRATTSGRSWRWPVTEIVGGLTAHALPMTRAERSEMFIYDVAVRPDYQRQGVGRRLMAAVRDAARDQGIDDVFVAADEDDAHALDFYRSLGGSPSMSAIFTFPAEGR